MVLWGDVVSQAHRFRKVYGCHEIYGITFLHVGSDIWRSQLVMVSLYVKRVAILWCPNSLWGSQNLGVRTHHGARKILVSRGPGWLEILGVVTSRMTSDPWCHEVYDDPRCFCVARSRMTDDTLVLRGPRSPGMTDFRSFFPLCLNLKPGWREGANNNKIIHVCKKI